MEPRTPTSAGVAAAGLRPVDFVQGRRYGRTGEASVALRACYAVGSVNRNREP